MPTVGRCKPLPRVPLLLPVSPTTIQRMNARNRHLLYVLERRKKKERKSRWTKKKERKTLVRTPHTTHGSFLFPLIIFRLDRGTTFLFEQPVVSHGIHSRQASDHKTDHPQSLGVGRDETRHRSWCIRGLDGSGPSTSLGSWGPELETMYHGDTDFPLFIFCFQISRLYSALKSHLWCVWLFFFIEAHARHHLHPMLRCILMDRPACSVFFCPFSTVRISSLFRYAYMLEKESRCSVMVSYLPKTLVAGSSSQRVDCEAIG